MDLQSLATEFLSSDHGQQAMSALAALGVTGGQATDALTHATTAVGAHAEDHAAGSGLLGSQPGTSFFAAFAAGLVKGDGIFGALKDGAEGVVAGRVAEAIESKLGVPSGTATSIAAAATPYVVAFVQQKLGGR